MPGALFSRLKVWTAKEVLTYTDLNLEFNNIINNLEADTLGGYSNTVAQMQETTDPGGVGTESLAASISDEIERIRFVLARIVGKSNWYEAPAKNLSASFSKVRHIYCPQNQFDEPIQQAAAEAYRAGILGGRSDFLSFSAPGKFSAAAIVNNPTFPNLMLLDHRCIAGSLTYSFWARGFNLNETILFNAVLGLRAYVNSSGFLQVDIQKATTTGLNKEVASVVTTVNIAGSTSYRHILIAYRLSGTSLDSLNVYIDGVLSGTPIINQSIHGNVPTINQTTFLFSNISKTTTFSTNMNALPESLGWTKTSTAGTATVSGGVLNAVNTTAQTQYWSRAVPASGSGAVNWVEFKFRIVDCASTTTVPASANVEGIFSVIIRNGAQGARLNFTANMCAIHNSNALAFGTNTRPVVVNHDFTQWTHVVFNMNATTNIASVTINGKPSGIMTGAATDAAASGIFFGKTTTGVGGGTYEMEYINGGTGACGMSTTTPVALQSISDFCVFEGSVTDAGLISSLQKASPFALFGEEQDTRMRYASNRRTTSDPAQTVAVGVLNAATLPAVQPQVEFYSNGVDPVRIEFDYDAVSSGTAGTTIASIWLVVAGNPPGIPGFTNAYSFVGSSANPTSFAGGTIAQKDVRITIPANNIPISGTVVYQGVLPAGDYNVRAWCLIATGGQAIIFHNQSYRCVSL